MPGRARSYKTPRIPEGVARCAVPPASDAAPAGNGPALDQAATGTGTIPLVLAALAPCAGGACAQATPSDRMAPCATRVARCAATQPSPPLPGWTLTDQERECAIAMRGPQNAMACEQGSQAAVRQGQRSPVKGGEYPGQRRGTRDPDAVRAPCRRPESRARNPEFTVGATGASFRSHARSLCRGRREEPPRALRYSPQSIQKVPSGRTVMLASRKRTCW